jgi:hypothetical protein
MMREDDDAVDRLAERKPAARTSAHERHELVASKQERLARRSKR